MARELYASNDYRHVTAATGQTRYCVLKSILYFVQEQESIDKSTRRRPQITLPYPP